MDLRILLFFVPALLWRIGTVLLSRRNERRLEARGAEEFGVLNSRVLTGLHAAFYLFALIEGYLRGAQVAEITFWGIGLYLFSMVMLGVVWYHLGEMWTIRLYEVPADKVNQSWLFRIVRHPNYFLNIVPELIGLALLLQAWNVLTVGGLFYSASLGVRIVQEERMMRKHFRVSDDECRLSNAER